MDALVNPFRCKLGGRRYINSLRFGLDVAMSQRMSYAARYSLEK